MKMFVSNYFYVRSIECNFMSFKTDVTLKQLQSIHSRAKKKYIRYIEHINIYAQPLNLY